MLPKRADWNKLRELLSALRTQECGQDMIEYILFGALVALASIAAISSVGQAASALFTNIGATFSSAV